MVLCAVQSSPCSACWWIERYKVLLASEKWLGIAVLWCVGRVLSRVCICRAEQGEFCPAHRVRLPDRRGCEACGAWPGFEATRRAKLAAWAASGRAGLAPHGRSGGVRRTEVWRLEEARRSGGGMPSEARWDGGCGAGGHGRPIGGWCEACRAWPGFEATRRAKLAARTTSGRAGLAPHGDLAGLAPHGDLAGLAPHGGLATGCLADGERAGRRPPAHRADADNRMCWA